MLMLEYLHGKIWENGRLDLSATSFKTLHFPIIKYQTMVPNDDDRAKPELRNTTIANKIQEWAAGPSVDSAATIH